jgi:Rps23 Pro-64 3,4-dihydroxylase Tpa1-like proline 4-hydroxylase
MTTPAHFEADIDRLKEIAAAGAAAYRDAKPFAHIMIENFIKPDVLEAVLAECEQGGADWHHMKDEDQNKFATTRTARMGPKTRALIQFLNGQEMMEFLEKLTGIERLIPDPQLAGGGLHELRPGGFLRVHADFNYQRHLKLDRRINLLLYLNKGWEESWGGNLELWDENTTACVKRYTPEFNRCVIFNTTDTSFHGNPQPVKTPDGRTRRSIALYYYSNGRPADEVSPQHMTIFRKRPEERTAVDAGKSLLRQLTPPILFDGLRRLKGKSR